MKFYTNKFSIIFSSLLSICLLPNLELGDDYPVPKPHHTQMTASIVYFFLSFNRMVEPSPPALHIHSSGDVNMAGVGVKVEREDSGGGAAVDTSGELRKTSPSRDWSGTQSLEARQLTPPLSRSPSVRITKGMTGNFRKSTMCHRLVYQNIKYICMILVRF